MIPNPTVYQVHPNTYIMALIIVLSGKKRHGKTTIANYLSSMYDMANWTFAEPLKKAVQAKYDLTDKQMEDLKEVVDERYGVTPRELLQIEGDAARVFLPSKLSKFKTKYSVFTDIMMNKLTEVIEGTMFDPIITISDARMPDEHQMLKDLKAKFPAVTVVRMRVVNNNHEDSGIGSKHHTETFDFPFDYLIDNSGSIKRLHKNVKLVMDKIYNTCRNPSIIKKPRTDDPVPLTDKGEPASVNVAVGNHNLVGNNARIITFGAV